MMCTECLVYSIYLKMHLGNFSQNDKIPSDKPFKEE